MCVCVCEREKQNPSDGVDFTDNGLDYKFIFDRKLSTVSLSLTLRMYVYICAHTHTTMCTCFL